MVSTMTEDEMRAAIDELREENMRLRRDYQGLMDALGRCRSDCVDFGTARFESRDGRLVRIRPRDEATFGIEDLAL